MIRVALNGIDRRVRRARCKGQRRVTESRAQFQDAARIGRRRQRSEQRAVIISIGTAAVLRAMRGGRGLYLGEGIESRNLHRMHPA